MTDYTSNATPYEVRGSNIYFTNTSLTFKPVASFYVSREEFDQFKHHLHRELFCALVALVVFIIVVKLVHRLFVLKP